MASNDRIQKKLRVPDEIVALIRGCHPQLKRKIRAGLRHIVTEPDSGKSLKDELVGLRSYRISRFRIICRTSSKKNHRYCCRRTKKNHLRRDLSNHQAGIRFTTVTRCAQIVPVKVEFSQIFPNGTKISLLHREDDNLFWRNAIYVNVNLAFEAPFFSHW